MKSWKPAVIIAAGTLVRSCKLAIRAAIVIVLILGLGVGARHVEAVSVDWDGDAGNGLWSDPLNWSGDTLPQSGDTISISGSAGEVVLDTDFTLVGKLTIDGNGATLRINSGVTLTLDPSLPPGQYDTVIVDNGATIINDGVVEGVDLSPLSRILVTSTESTFINNDTLNVLEVSLRGGATLNNDGTMNTVRISTLTGTLNNSGLIDDAQISLQFGTVNNDVGGTVNITFTLSSMGSKFINNTVFDNYGTVTNEATIENSGTFNNFGTFDNTNGSFINTCNFNSGTAGHFNDTGVFLGNPISNECALWDNDSGNGLWSDPLNWTGDVLPASTDDIIINIVNGVDTAATVDVNTTIDGRLALMNSAGPPVTSTLVIQSGATLTNNGKITPGQNTTVNNQGSIVNNNEIRADCSVSFINAGSFSGNPVLGICSTWDGGAGNGLWSDPLNWSGDRLPQTGDTISIPGSAGEVVLNTDFTLIGKLTVDGNGATLRIDNGVTLTLDPKLAPGQFDTVIVDNGATIINDGVVQGVNLSPLPRILVTSTESTFINNDTLNVLEVFLRGSATLNNDGTMNTVRISTLTGTINNGGLIDDAQISLQFGTVNNEAGGAINTSFTLSTMGSRFINSTVFDNYGTVTNAAAIENSGTFNNFGTFDNTNGTFDNQGAFNSECGSILLGTISGNPVNEILCNATPVVDAGVNQTVNEGDPVSLDPATFTDADVTDIHTATISWGDSSPMESGIISEGGGSGTVSGSHIYTDDGTYTVTVCVADGTVEACDSLIVTVNDLGPMSAFSWSPEPQYEGSAVVFSDASTSYPDSVVSWSWDFAGLGVSSDQNPTFSFTDDGVYPVSLTVADEDSSADTTVNNVTVINADPVVSGGPDQNVYIGETTDVMATFTDAGEDDNPWSWTIDWGDGSSDGGSTGSQSAPITGSHIYLDPDDYQVTITVTDKDGGSGEYQLTISAEVLRTDIDIKPGSWPNSLNLNGNGSVPVGIFGSTEFNVHDIDKSTVRCGLTGLEAVPVHKGYCGHVEDLNEDGIDDMVFHFREGELGIPVDTEGNEELILLIAGQLDNGICFEGTDIVRITPNNENSRGKGGKGPK